MMAEAVRAWLSEFSDGLQKQDVCAVVELFQEEECFWRDLLAFTWNIYTAESKHEIAAMLEATLDEVKPDLWELDGEVTEAGGVMEAMLKFETAAGRGRGVVRLKDGKCWTMQTAVRELKGYEEKVGQARPHGVVFGAVPGRKTWRAKREEEEGKLGHSVQPYCVVVGGGQAGIALGARLRRLEVPTIVVEKNNKPGDSWRNRYSSLHLHSPVWGDHMAYLPFPESWPIYPSKDEMADWLEAYSKLMQLHFWGSTEAKSAKYDSSSGCWELVLDRAGEQVILRPAHLVLATGMCGVPQIPTIAGSSSFRGLQLHSSQYRGADGSEKGKHCIVVGCNTSAHDICADLWEQGCAEVTMVQRSSGMVIRSETLYSPTHSYGIPGLFVHYNSPWTLDTADLMLASFPHKVLPRLQTLFSQAVQEQDAAFYARLKKSGFQLDFGEDGSGLLYKYYRRGAGYYIDTGASDMIVRGEIKLKTGVSVEELKPQSVVFTDGTEVPADLIVYATGYTSMTTVAAKLISQEVADKVGRVWGLGSGTARDPGPWERELRNMWKPTHQEGLWFHGGAVQESRSFSLVLALQIKARYQGISTPVYGMQPVFHLS